MTRQISSRSNALKGKTRNCELIQNGCFYSFQAVSHCLALQFQHRRL